MMGLFDQLGHQTSKQYSPEQQMDPRKAQQAFQNDLASLKADPVAYAKAHGKNIPDGMTDPNQMVQYLLKSTQVNNPRYQMAMRLISSMTGR